MRNGALGALGRLPLFVGGPTGGALVVLHRWPDLAGSAVIDPGADNEAASGGGGGGGGALCVGGDLGELNARLEAGGAAAAASVKVFVGETVLPLRGSSAEDLELPDDDAHLLAEGPGVADVALLPPQFDSVGLFRDGHGLGASDRVVGYNHARFFAQNAVWRAAVLALADGEAALGAGAWAAALRAAADLHPAAIHAVAAAAPLRVTPPPTLELWFQRL